ncbi:MAG: 50S ribosomal protein L10 [Phycisphaerales bacterium]|nr:50S ribosomal protein L10 [Phycisphaerales bacterium]
MSRAVKSMVEKDVKSRYESLDSVLVIDVLGLSGNDANAFRGELRKKDVEVHVVKNSAASRALSGTVLEPLATRLTGSCAFVTGGTSPVDTAKELIRLAKEYPALGLKEGLVEGEPDVLTIEEISKRKSRTELQGEIVMLAMSPGRRIAGQLNVGGKIAGCIKAIVDKLEKGEKITKVA